VINTLEQLKLIYPAGAIERFLLADLYALRGSYGRAEEQYQILAKKYPSLARELKKILQKRHAKRFPQL
jgi:protein involved in temperature-dependent protein secretion